MATTAARPSPSSARRRAGSHGSTDGRRKPAAATKEETKPERAPEKAHKPGSAARAGPPRKAHKPESAGGARPRAKGAKPSAGASGPNARGKAGKGQKAGKVPEASGRRPKAGKTPVASQATTALVHAVSPKPSSLKGKATLKLARHLAHRALPGGVDTVAEVSRSGLKRGVRALGIVRQRAIAASSTSVDIETVNRPPVQSAVDAGVPAAVAWAEWMRLEWLPEGVDRVLKVKRNGDGELTGQLRGDGGHRWAAQILDEREEESFAWESSAGSDCAGLITFHALGERLTRIELSLDIRPVSIAQAVALATRLADRRATADLRRFKARLELINPDLYLEDSMPQSD